MCGCQITSAPYPRLTFFFLHKHTQSGHVGMGVNTASWSLNSHSMAIYFWTCLAFHSSLGVRPSIQICYGDGMELPAGSQERESIPREDNSLLLLSGFFSAVLPSLSPFITADGCIGSWIIIFLYACSALVVVVIRVAKPFQNSMYKDVFLPPHSYPFRSIVFTSLSVPRMSKLVLPHGQSYHVCLLS